MDIDKPQIARLVLGYLKSENCTKAFHEFLIKSPHLKSLAVFVKNGKYFATRVGGLTLEDILKAYSEVSFIIQGRLEETKYYEKEHRMKLSDQLLYILDHNSRSTSPTLPNDLNATPSESLPGNSEFENTSNISSTYQKDEKKTAMAELDNQLKSIEAKAEQDPAFDRILEEIIGHKNLTSMEGFASKKISDKSRSCNSNIQAAKSSNSTVNSDNLSSKETAYSNHPVCTKNSDIIVVDPYANKPIAASSQQSQYILTNTPQGLLMVPSVMGAQNYILVNSGQAAKGTSLGNVLTESDIMKMPTVILDDCPSVRPLMPVPQPQMAAQRPQVPTYQPPPVLTQSQIIVTSLPQTTITAQRSSNCHMATSQSETLSQGHGVRRVKTIAPKTDKITMATSDGDYYKVFDDDAHLDSPPKVSEAETAKKSPINRPVLRRRLSRSSKSKYKTNSPDVVESPSKHEPRKSVKSLFTDNKNNPKKNVWDSDLRELLIPNPDTKRANLDTSDDRMDFNDTCDDEELKKGAMLIEAAFKTPVKTREVQEEEEVAAKEEITRPTEAVNSEEKSETDERVVISEEVEEFIETEETEVYLRNCNGPPRFKKKCNQTTTSVEIFQVEVIKDSSPDEPKSEVKIEPNSSKVRKHIVLETPVKGGNVPKTPGKFEMTPFTRVLEEQMQGMDLLSLSTPMLTITPGLPITPNIDLNTPDHHSNRPTDYSTSSSYYQPSDTEQNKSLEVMMEEYRREDRGKEETRKIEENINDEKDLRIVTEMKRMFNENVIGKKNLSMMKQEDPSGLCDSSNSSNTSSSSNSDSSSDSDSDSVFEDSTSKQSITSPKEPYNFRKRKSPVPKSPSTNKPTPSPKSGKKVISVEQEIREKRERTIRAIKKDNMKSSTPAQNRNPPRRKNGKFAKFKTKRISPQANKEMVEKCDVENEITDDDFALHLSTDEDSTNKINNETIINKNKDEIASKTTNSVGEPATEEAKQLLIQGLSERGIYLVPKVSPKKDLSSDVTKPSSEDENALENLDVSSEDNNSFREENEEETSDLSSLRNLSEVTFDIKNYGEEDALHYVYDHRKDYKRKKKVYDLELLKKIIHADVYVESLDRDIVRYIQCTPTETFAEYVPPIKAPVKRRRSVKPGSASEPVRSKKIKQRKETSTKSDPEAKIVDTENKYTKEEKKEPEPERSPQKKFESTETKTKKKTNTKRVKSDECFKSAPATSDSGNKSEKTVETAPFELELAERTVIERLENMEEEKLPAIGSGDDDLMNFAVVGNMMDEKNEVLHESRDKRKFSSDGENLPPEKKCKTEHEKNQALLKNINVDLFLDKLHGDDMPL